MPGEPPDEVREAFISRAVALDEQPSLAEELFGFLEVWPA